MLRYKAGYKYVEGGVHAQVLDFPAAITCGSDLDDARRQLLGALVDIAESYVAEGMLLPKSNELATDPEMDIEEPIYLHLSASTEFAEEPAGMVAP